MDASEAISNSTSIIIQLIDRIKDGKTAALVMQLQKNHFTVQQELVRLESENANLALDKRGFESRVLQLEDSHRQAIAQMKQGHADEIAKMTAAHAKPKADELEDTAKQMLISLANNPLQNTVTDGELIQLFGLPKAKGDYFFKQLRDRKLVYSGTGVIGRGSLWHVTDAGTQYLKEHDLLDAKPQIPIPRRSSGGGMGFMGRML